MLVRLIGYNRSSATQSAPQRLFRGFLTSTIWRTHNEDVIRNSRCALALTAFAGTMLSSASHAESGTVALTIYKAGWIIGGSGGGGTLNFRGRATRSPPAGSIMA